ncbi:MAG: Gfo/Idh/MocA family oxidoreductase [Candidatus Omnitrophica bacterium]|nr:Gfo/Idh/MocA family oxidoreductase [Candidatus Omnitrophota bacterium]
MNKVKVGIIGAGGIAQVAHIPCYQKADQVEVTIVADVNEEKLRYVANKFNIPKAVKDWRDVLNEPVDAVSICSPNVFHAKQSIAALKTGKHVLCEKPVCLKSREVEEIFQAAKKSGKKFMAAFPRRFSGEAKVLRNMISRGDFGDIYYVKTGYLRRRGIPGLGTWFTERGLAGGGPMMDIGVHALDFVIHLLGAPQPQKILGVTFDYFRDQAVDGGWPPAETRIGDKPLGSITVEDMAAAFVKLSGGICLYVEASWAAHLAPQFYTIILGKKAGAQMPDPANANQPLKVFSEMKNIMTDITPTVPKSDVFQEEINHFLECIRKDTQPITTKQEILSVVKIIEAIYRSAKTGKPVSYSS